MHHLKAFDMINLQYEIKFDKKLLTKPQLTKTRTGPPPSIEQTAPLSYALCTEVTAEVTTAHKGLLK